MQEAYLFDRNQGTPMPFWAIAIVAMTLAVLIITCIVLAVSRQLDPLGLGSLLKKGTGSEPKSEKTRESNAPEVPVPLLQQVVGDRGRQAYVYAAEVLLVLIGLHLRMTVPWLFRLGIVERYWMLLVMAVAFAGAGLSEFFHRRRLPVLSEPLERTALLLPLLPALGFWFAPDPASAWGIIGRTPVLWCLMRRILRQPGLHAAFGRLCRSGGAGGQHRPVGGLARLRHRISPSPATVADPHRLGGMVAEYLNHDRLSAAQSTAFRYLALSVIYLSSTADMFIAGLGKDWRLPLVLMLLSVAGVLAGLLLRIRSFLWLGIVFLLLDITAMIWHAAVDLEQTWIWYACGIVLGAVIIALFALFEKRRNDLLATVGKLKQWER